MVNYASQVNTIFREWDIIIITIADMKIIQQHKKCLHYIKWNMQEYCLHVMGKFNFERNC